MATPPLEALENELSKELRMNDSTIRSHNVNSSYGLDVVPDTRGEAATAAFPPESLTGVSEFTSPRIPQSVREGKPLEIDLGLIVEDTNQPRKENNPGFSAESLGELAQSIRERGIKTPISLRNNAALPGQYVINHGARRYRAAQLAGLKTVPAFIDQDYTEVDQVVENLQRNELTAREIAEFISREVNRGVKKGEIAKRIGKSNAFISQHLALMDLPEPIAVAFSGGRVEDVTAINELVKLHQAHATEVELWLGTPDVKVTRHAVKQLRKAMAPAFAIDPTVAAYIDVVGGPITDIGDRATGSKKSNDSGRQLAPPIRKPVVLLEHRGKEARLLYDRYPDSHHRAWIRYEKSGGVASIELTDLELVGLLEG